MYVYNVDNTLLLVVFAYVTLGLLIDWLMNYQQIRRDGEW